MDNFMFQDGIAVDSLEMFMLPIRVMIAFRSLTVMAHSLPNGVLKAAMMDNFLIHRVLLSILLAMFMLPIQVMIAFRSLTVTVNS